MDRRRLDKIDRLSVIVAPFPLTPALSHAERENRRKTFGTRRFMEASELLWLRIGAINLQMCHTTPSIWTLRR